jgi:THO complex subunit 1
MLWLGLLPRDTHELKADQAEWVREKTEMVYGLLEETPPDGVTFVQTVKHILKVNYCSVDFHC